MFITASYNTDLRHRLLVAKSPELRDSSIDEIKLSAKERVYALGVATLAAFASLLTLGLVKGLRLTTLEAWKQFSQGNRFCLIKLTPDQEPKVKFDEQNEVRIFNSEDHIDVAVPASARLSAKVIKQAVGKLRKMHAKLELQAAFEAAQKKRADERQAASDNAQRMAQERAQLWSSFRARDNSASAVVEPTSVQTSVASEISEVESLESEKEDARHEQLAKLREAINARRAMNSARAGAAQASRINQGHRQRPSVFFDARRSLFHGHRVGK